MFFFFLEKVPEVSFYTEIQDDAKKVGKRFLEKIVRMTLCMHGG